jgi:hypothetical protein
MARARDDEVDLSEPFAWKVLATLKAGKRFREQQPAPTSK